MTLTYELVSGIIESGAYCCLGSDPKFGVWIRLGMEELCIPLWVTLILILFLA